MSLLSRLLVGGLEFCNGACLDVGGVAGGFNTCFSMFTLELGFSTEEGCLELGRSLGIVGYMVEGLHFERGTGVKS